MSILKMVLTVAALGMVSLALAGEESKTKIAIEVIGDGGDGDVHIAFNSDDSDFNLHEMQEGENRSIVDESGRTILVTRKADGFTFEVDGKTIEMPLFDGEHHGAVFIGGEHAETVDVQVIGDATWVSDDDMPGTMIMSAKPIDEATQQAIESLLQSAGHGDKVHFVDHDGPHAGPHQVKVIKKKVEITE